MIVPAVLAIYNKNWVEFMGIIVLLVINSTITFVVAFKAANVAEALISNLAPKTKVGI